MENEHVVAGLIRKRAEIAGELEALQARIAQLFAHLDSLDVTIRLFAPGAELDAIRPKQPAAEFAALPGETSRVVVDALREASVPLTTHDLTLRVMAARGFDVEDQNLFLTMQKRVLASLRNLRMRERVRSDRRSGRNLRWGIADP